MTQDLHRGPRGGNPKLNAQTLASAFSEPQVGRREATPAPDAEQETQQARRRLLINCLAGVAVVLVVVGLLFVLARGVM